MSVFTNIEVSCPACEADVPFRLVDSVNVTRELTESGIRSSLLDRTFQREQCPVCGEEFRIEPAFSYLDFNHDQFIGVWASGKVDEFSRYEAITVKTFNISYGEKASSIAQDIGSTLKTRVVFGWNSLNEKLLAADANIDDVTLELAKLSLLVKDGPGEEDNEELRLIGVDKEYGLILGWFALGSETLNEKILLPREIIHEIESEPDAWKELRDQLESGLFVDYRKLFLEALV